MSTHFTVMSWNVENLFPPGHVLNPWNPNNMITDEEYEAKLAYLATVVGEIQPDVLALQEIGSPTPDNTRSFDDLQGRLFGLYPHMALSPFPDGRGIRVGFLSKLPILDSDDLTAFAPGELSQVVDWEGKAPNTTLGRGALLIEVEAAPGVRVRLLTLHLKSKLVTYPARGTRPRFDTNNEDERARGTGLALLRRTAEAVAVRVYLNALMLPGDATHTIVLGDLNDEPRAATSQLLQGPTDADVTSNDRRDFVRLYNLMDAIPGPGPASNDKWFLPQKERFSRIYMGRGELIDHILVSKGLLGRSEDLKQDRWLLKEVRSLVGSIQGESIGNIPSDRIGKERPDHAPVYAHFELDY